jgi:hypothetical protein
VIIVILLLAFGQGIRIFLLWQFLQIITGVFKVSGVRFQVSGFSPAAGLKIGQFNQNETFAT